VRQKNNLARIFSRAGVRFQEPFCRQQFFAEYSFTDGGPLLHDAALTFGENLKSARGRIHHLFLYPLASASQTVLFIAEKSAGLRVMKILGIMASPRKGGNTDLLMTAIHLAFMNPLAG
jgi:hypothetical protein